MSEVKQMSVYLDGTEEKVVVLAYVSDVDGATVIQVDTLADTGQVRIYLNEGIVWSGDPEAEE